MVRANRDLRHSLYWRSRRKLPTGRHRGHLPGHMSPPGAQGAGGELVAPDRVARPQNLQQVYADSNEVQGGNGNWKGCVFQHSEGLRLHQAG